MNWNFDKSSKQIPNPMITPLVMASIRTVRLRWWPVHDEVNKKVSDAWNQLFHGNPKTQAVYYQMTPTKAYIEDIGNGDVRTEGMGYGMMIAL